MEEKLAALHGFRLPTYKRARGQPRHDDPCPTFFVETPAQRLSTALVKPLQAIWDQQWTAREAELRSQRRGRQTYTAAGTPDASEWTPEQRQAFLALLKTRQQDQIDGKTVCDCDRLLAELFNASQRGRQFSSGRMLVCL